MKKAKSISALAAALLVLGALGACAVKSAPNNTAGGWDGKKAITVVSREEGSGTRSGFIELFGVEVKNEDGTKTDRTTEEAIIADKTDIMLTNVSGDPYAVGYVSLGSLKDSVKALKIDGVDATVENVKKGIYKIQRPFNIVYKGEPDGLTKDFIDFIFSTEGQQVIADNKYSKVYEKTTAFAGTKPAGKIVITGSSSVTPVMEKLREAYLELNPVAKIEITQSDSSGGISDAMKGICDIGMASRELKDAEKAELNESVIAVDGIAVIVNNANANEGLTTEQVCGIFTGEILKWDDIE